MEYSMLHRKDNLIITAIDIIDQLGIQGLSTREIAKRQGISEATLFRHFKNKSELLSSILDYYSKFDDDIFNSTTLKNLSAIETILFFVNSYVEYNENYPAITSIMHIMDVLRYDRDNTNKVNEIYNKRIDNIRILVENAKKSNEIILETDSTILASTILGLMREVCLKWRLDGKCYSLREKTMKALEMVIKAFKSAKES